MHAQRPDVKSSAGKNPGPILRWIDAHPRTGWYVSLIVTLDLVLNLIDVFHGPVFH